jgi:hypothetical protein
MLRGINKADLFMDDADRVRFLVKLGEVIESTKCTDLTRGHRVCREKKCELKPGKSRYVERYLRNVLELTGF